MIEAIKVNPQFLSRTLGLPVEKVEATVALLYSGCSTPFIMRYRKDATCLKDDDVVRVVSAFEKHRKFADRKYSYLKTLEERGQLTDELRERMLASQTVPELDDLYLPFKAKNDSPAQGSRSKGLEPLAQAILTATDETTPLEELAAPYADATRGVESVQAALAGAAEIIAESFSENADLRQGVRAFIRRSGRVVVSHAVPSDGTPATPTADKVAAAEPNAPETAEKPADAAPESGESDAAKKRGDDVRSNPFDRVYAEFFNSSFGLRELSRYQILTISRGVAFKVLTSTIEYDKGAALEIATKSLALENRAYSAFLTPIVETALNLYVGPALEQEIWRDQVENALDKAVASLCSSLFHRIMRRPATNARVLVVDLANRGSGRLAAVDEKGAPLEVATGVLRGAEERVAETVAKIVELVEKHNLNVVAYRTSGRRRDVEHFVTKILSEQLAARDLGCAEVSDAGIDALAAAPETIAELADYDPSARCAILLGRRLIDPFREYSKVSPEFLCDDAFCRRIRVKTLREILAKIVGRAANLIGFDANAASSEELKNVVGFSALSAENFVKYREEHGPFKSREQFKEVVGVSDATFAQCSGFLRIVDGDNPLDATWIHPERYPVATAVLEKFGFSVDDLRDPEKRAEFAEKTKNVDVKALATEFDVGPLTLADVLSELANPGQDVRLKQPYPVFRRKSVRIEDLKPGTELIGDVTRVVDYGAFVDFGGEFAGLAHVSRLTTENAVDARRLVSVGEKIKVWVVSVDVAQGRVALSAVNPSELKERESRRGERDAEKKERRPQRRRNDQENGEGDGERRHGRGGRNDRNNRGGRGERGARSVELAPKEKELKPLSEEKKSGKQSLQGFDELKQFFGL